MQLKMALDTGEYMYDMISILTILTILASNTILTVMAQDLGNQPDFAVAAQALQTTDIELAKCPNLPAVQGGEAIIGMLQALETRMFARLDTIAAQIEAVAAQVEAGAVRQQAS